MSSSGGVGSEPLRVQPAETTLPEFAVGRQDSFPFPLVDEYLGTLLGVDLSALTPGRVGVVESDNRLGRHLSYGFVHALWWVWLEDGRSAVSAPPGAGAVVGKMVQDVRSSQDRFDPSFIGELKRPVSQALSRARLEPVDRVLSDLMFAGNASLLRRHAHGDCRRLTDTSLPAAEDLALPTHCFPDGIVYGVVIDGRVVSYAHAHRAGVMEDSIADLGVETAPGYRRRGYAKTAVAAVVDHITRAGGEALYKCAPANLASAATARSVGFVPYGTGLILTASDPEPKDDE